MLYYQVKSILCTFFKLSQHSLTVNYYYVLLDEDVACFLLESLHPTPAVCGFPKDDALNIIREYESHDRGYYAGPFGYLGSDSTEIVVAIRSSLLTQSRFVMSNFVHTVLK